MSEHQLNANIRMYAILTQNGIELCTDNHMQTTVSIDTVVEELLETCTVPVTAPAYDPDRAIPARDRQIVDEVNAIAQMFDSAAQKLRTALKNGSTTN